ncbi:271631ca-8155-4618-879a-dd8ae6293e82 [Sclerotinia trifoliorum]|uniref:Cutinase n=1 Tax=Sclerotinia trifoliorum TaxID=28548 RepID=A0A8H2ZNX7_9HELO|nr:271631ca-8155-4618-879a-dd8ae6293e82 [Sclerotinia trifoliorum]
MKFSIPILLSLSSIVLALPLAETEARSEAVADKATTDHLASTAHFFEESAVVAAAAASTTPTVVTTENGLTTDACKPVIVIFARGTNEVGNVGQDVGPYVFTDLRAALTTAKVTVQGVDYAANVLGYLEGGDPTGSTTMANLTNTAAAKCPSAKLVLSGYSQGAQLLHNAASTLSAAVTARIAAVVMFGDPDNGKAVGTVPTSKVLSICHDQDIVCTGSGWFTTHLTYSTNAQAASDFIVSAVGAV